MNYTLFNCEKCSLCVDQKPLMYCGKKCNILVVGLSSKKRKYEDELPLDTRTRSGKFVDELETFANNHQLSICRTNLVKGPPYDQNKKLRYPNREELSICFDHFLHEIDNNSPQIIILLGDLVRQTVAEKLNITIMKPTENNIYMVDYNKMKIVAIYHPSYLLRSKQRKQRCLELLKELITV